MRVKLMSVLAAVALVAACESTPESSGAAKTSGASTATSSAPARSVGVMAGSQEDLVVNVGDRVFFAYDKFDLSKDAQATLGKQAAWMKKFPSVSLTVEGHCDERGTREYNLALGERRANSAKDYLVGLGVNPARVKTISYGKERPAALSHNEASWAQNRRSVSVVTSTGS